MAGDVSPVAMFDFLSGNHSPILIQQMQIKKMNIDVAYLARSIV